MQLEFVANVFCAHAVKRAVLTMAVGSWAMLAQGAEPVGTGGKTYTVKPGDTLDKVVRTQMADSPLRADLLKEALVSQNPGAFAKGSPKMLLSGATLQLPNQEALLRKHLGHAAPLSENAGGVESGQARKHWVRYP